MNTIREKIWYFLLDTKTNESLASRIVRKYQIFDLWTNIFIAFATSSSIAAWTIWDKYSSIWILIIGISQVIMITKPYFLFPKYINVFSEKSVHWQHLAVELEKLWHNLEEEYIDERKASDIYFELREKSLVFDTIPDDIIFFDHKKLQKKAEFECEIFLKKI